MGMHATGAPGELIGWQHMLSCHASKSTPLQNCINQIWQRQDCEVNDRDVCNCASSRAASQEGDVGVGSRVGARLAVRRNRHIVHRTNQQRRIT